MHKQPGQALEVEILKEALERTRAKKPILPSNLEHLTLPGDGRNPHATNNMNALAQRQHWLEIETLGAASRYNPLELLLCFDPRTFN